MQSVIPEQLVERLIASIRANCMVIFALLKSSQVMVVLTRLTVIHISQLFDVFHFFVSLLESGNTDSYIVCCPEILPILSA